MSRDKCDRETAYTKTAKTGPAEYSRRLKQICQSFNSSNLKENHLVFLDKNHPKDAIEKLIDEIWSSLPKNVEPKFLYLIPQIDPKNFVYNLPLSASFILQALSRCQKREDHATLDN